MTIDPNLTYYADRAVQERQRAAQSSDRTAKALHLELAGLYEAKLAAPGSAIPLRAVS